MDNQTEGAPARGPLSISDQLEKLRRLKKIHLSGKVIKMDVFNQMMATEKELKRRIKEKKGK